MTRSFWLFAVLVVLLSAVHAHAYPEYAVRYNILRCTACHLNPSGGGPKTVAGKLFGAHSYEINPRLVQDYIGVDLRGLFIYPEKPNSSRGGAGIMSGSVSGHVALDQAERVHLVIEQNIAGFSTARYRDTYALFKFADENGKAAAFDSLLIGRFRIPFGLITDEHRTYTRVQTATEWYSMDTGAMLSGTPTDQLHYDLALVNGDKTPGDTLTSGQAERLGGVANIRYMPGAMMLGASSSYYDRSPRSQSRQALSLYTVLSLARWSDDRAPLTLEIEHVRARNWSDHLSNGFASDPAYVSALSHAESTGWLACLNYALNLKWTFIYKYDLLTPDRQFPADIYERHGFGFRWAVAPNTLIWARTELARATHPSENSKTGSAAQNASYAILQLGF